jgi:hypothetical protein
MNVVLPLHHISIGPSAALFREGRRRRDGAPGTTAIALLLARNDTTVWQSKTRELASKEQKRREGKLKGTKVRFVQVEFRRKLVATFDRQSQGGFKVAFFDGFTSNPMKIEAGNMWFCYQNGLRHGKK